MQLSPLQSRLAASMIASFLLLVLYIVLFAPPFAFAAELDHSPRDHDSFYDLQDTLDIRDALYEPDFPLFDRSILGRASDGSQPIEADVAPVHSNLTPDQTIGFVFQAASVSGRTAQPPELRRGLDANGSGDTRQEIDGELDPRSELTQRASKTLWISANTCDQPSRLSSQTTMDPPQLTLYVSTSSKNTSPGPGQDANTQKAIVFDEGAVTYNTSVEEDVYFSISVPPVSEQYFSTALPYNFAVSVSLNQYYYSYNSNDDDNAVFVDSDASASLLKTAELNSDPEEQVSTAPYTLFVQNADNPNINGIRNSYCGLARWAQIRPLGNGATDGLTVGLKKDPKTNKTMQEFYISGLNASSNYAGIMVRMDNHTDAQKRQAGGSTDGVVVYKAVSFATKPQGPCTFIFNLTLCTDTQYAVPGNSTRFPNVTALAAFYDNYTQTMWDNFDKILQQTPCEAPSTQKYSLARGCDDCRQTYKDWLCSVAIPRCDDFSSPNVSYIQPRNINAPFANGTFVDPQIRDFFGNRTAYNSSRNPMIDEVVQPGPYKEVLPCDYLCYNITKSCPASMGFGCPLLGKHYSASSSYASPNISESLSCNYPGSAFYPSAAPASVLPWSAVSVTLLVTGFALMF